KGHVGATVATATGLAAKRAQLEYRLNRMRGPGIGYDRGEHDRVAFVPMQYNIWLTGLVRWCDGLDLRMYQSSEDTAAESRWEELVIDRRIKDQEGFGQSSSSSLSYRQKRNSTEPNVEHGHGREPTAAPVMLDSIRVISHPDLTETAAGTK
ncbi:hypothetical protein BC939DRAFT_506814, partial [Gamsiella multidivaricata]|uniref:uncharacterized protein n=1 Tax=Gamsiella multidivaricata TaxID=101098 RepID=UPI002220F631